MLNELYPKLEASVFIVTYGRSGSTLVQNLLNALPATCIRGENDNLLAPIARAWNILHHSEQAAKMRTTGQVTTPSDPWFGYENVTAEAFGASLAESFTRTVLQPDTSTRTTGFKEIRWHNDTALFPVMLDFLRYFFPNTRILFNVRDHDAVCRSGWWKYLNPKSVRQTLCEAEALYTAYATRHPDVCLTLRYEHYVTGPDAWRPLFSFLETPYDPSLVQAVLDRKLTHLHNI